MTALTAILVAIGTLTFVVLALLWIKAPKGHKPGGTGGVPFLGGGEDSGGGGAGGGGDGGGAG